MLKKLITGVVLTGIVLCTQAQVCAAPAPEPPADKAAADKAAADKAAADKAAAEKAAAEKAAAEKAAAEKAAADKAAADKAAAEKAAADKAAADKAAADKAAADKAAAEKAAAEKAIADKAKADKAKADRIKQAEKLFTDGQEALFRGRYKQAIELLTKAVAADKTKTSYRMHLARAYHYDTQAPKAEKLLAEILKANPDHVEAGQLLGRLYTQGRQWKKVVAALEPLLKYRHDYSTYHMLAEAKYHLDDYEKARTYYHEAIKQNPKSASDHYQLGNIYLASNAFALAAGKYETAMALGVKSPVLHYKLASAYFNLRNYFGRISTVTVKSGQPSTVSGQWYLIEPVPGKKDIFRVAPTRSAIYHVAKAMATGLADRPDIRFLRANIYLNARRYQQAYDMFKAMEKKTAKEDKALYYYYFAQSAFGAGKYDEYLERLGQAIKLDAKAYKATLVEAYRKVAEQHNQSGDLDGYIKYLGMAVGEAPKSASLHLKLGNAFEEARKYAEAVVQWRMVLDIEPDHPQRMSLLNQIGKHAPPPAAAKPKTS